MAFSHYGFSIDSGLFTYLNRNPTTTTDDNARQQCQAQNYTAGTRPRILQAHQRTKSDFVSCFANDKNGQADREYRINYQEIDGAW